MTTKIEWTDETWNPVTGCTKVSQGCKFCYAETIANRFWGERKFTDVQCHPERLEIPLKWKKPRRVFVNSMSDLFHKDVSDGFIADVFLLILKTPYHTYQILTKRPVRMYEFMKDWKFPFPNVWLGVSVEDQETANIRIPWALKTPAAVRFVSYEPALGPVDFTEYLYPGYGCGGSAPDPLCECGWKANTLDWVIAGCESGQNARPANPDWFRSVRDQCQSAGVPFFLKQMIVNGKLTKMPELDGKSWSEYPEVE